MRRYLDFRLLQERLRSCHRWSANSRRKISNKAEKSHDVDRKSTLVLLRHGQSTWNKIPTFTGWCDVALTPEGESEAKEAGELLRDRGYRFDIAFTSELQRARQTCYMALEGLGGSLPVVEAWQLNERHYGALQGRAKDDPALFADFGEDQLSSWRRDFDSTPPPMLPNHPYFQDPPAPVTGESFRVVFTS
jgi:2,3-bisphosphoglycerate-dependent phosphoglycerate mutase